MDRGREDREDLQLVFSAFRGNILRSRRVVWVVCILKKIIYSVDRK